MFQVWREKGGLAPIFFAVFMGTPTSLSASFNTANADEDVGVPMRQNRLLAGCIGYFLKIA